MEDKKLEEAVVDIASEQGFNDSELEDIMNEIENLEKDFVSEQAQAEPSNEIHKEAKLAQVTPINSEGTSFQAQGTMNINLNFPVGELMASLTIDESGLKVQMQGVSISIDSESGCSVLMDGGVNFSVPVNNKSVKKAS